MHTYTQILYQIVFSTKHRQLTLHKDGRATLFKYMSVVIRNKKCFLYQINGVEDHIHILLHLHPSVALSDLVKDLKLASTAFIKKQNLFKDFSGWQDGYSAFTYSVERREILINYIKKQEEHHKRKSFQHEYIDLLKEHRIEFDERYLV